MVREIVKKAFRVVVPYDLYWIYRAAENLPQLPAPPDVVITPVDVAQVEASPYVSINRLGGFGGTESAGFGAWVDGKLVAVCWFWWGDRYRTRGNLWPIGLNAAKLVHIVTDPDFRGRGIAPALITAGVQMIRQRGFAEVYARIWHSNRSSLQAFQKGGWLRLAFAARIWGIPFRSKWLARQSLAVD